MKEITWEAFVKISRGRFESLGPSLSYGQPKTDAPCMRIGMLKTHRSMHLE